MDSKSYEVFGKYILLEKLAAGGMAEVFLARSPGAGGIGKFIAVKRILPQFYDAQEFVDMFKDEAKIAINLSHSNVVSIYEFGVEKNQFFLVMDYVEGRNLRQILNKMKKANGTFAIDQIIYMCKEVAAGLDHAHRCLDGTTGKPLNITHRDMSPQNIMISYEGEVKIVDFGIAKAESQLETTRAGTLKGKFGYMSPEQAEGQPVDLRTDIFSLGICLWELLANDRLFIANNEINTLRKIRDCQIPSLRKINPNIHAELERIVLKALARDRNLRYQTAAAMHRDLSRYLNRQFPDFSPHDFSVFIKTLFADEILDARRRLIDYAKINFDSLGVQTSQFNEDDSKRTVIGPDPTLQQNSSVKLQSLPVNQKVISHTHTHSHTEENQTQNSSIQERNTLSDSEVGYGSEEGETGSIKNVKKEEPSPPSLGKDIKSIRMMGGIKTQSQPSYSTEPQSSSIKVHTAAKEPQNDTSSEDDNAIAQAMLQHQQQLLDQAQLRISTQEQNQQQHHKHNNLHQAHNPPLSLDPEVEERSNASHYYHSSNPSVSRTSSSIEVESSFLARKALNLTTLVVFALIAYTIGAKFFPGPMAPLISLLDPHLKGLHTLLNIETPQTISQSSTDINNNKQSETVTNQTDFTEVPPPPANLKDSPDLTNKDNISRSSSTYLNNPINADLLISSTPSGAEIYLNGINTGKVTPSKIKIPGNEKFFITLKRSGYLDYQRRDLLKSELGLKFSATLQKALVGYLNIDVIPPRAAKLYINGLRLSGELLPIFNYAVPAETWITVRAEEPIAGLVAEERVYLTRDQKKSITLYLRKRTRIHR